MKGIIENVQHYPGNVGTVGGGIQSIWIAGDDGVVYFGHRHNFTRKAKHYKKGAAVTFDAVDNGRAHMDAINIDVEVPVNPTARPRDELISIQHLQDGAYVKRVRKHDGTEVSLIVKDGRLIISCLSEYERDMIWMYRRGPSGERREA